ncbi:DUF4127 family protein [Alkalibacterium sp. 20]|uniref:DUF4127 family protein n=1 Tax=Alkalibacterium sp. 20 TaxID=1798803 RepID=UPI0008FFE402|nr:DUF4127 family protein [Alkalibacterium sp. 20]OJF92122.1 hypothetical protein AX762_02645 [Alkalibacterium sp. 20]
MNILYLPIDERPCNTLVVANIAKTNKGIHLITPQKRLQEKKKIPAITQELWQWVEQEAAQCEGLIFSPELMLYGGLIPSRIHHLSDEKRDSFIEKLIKLKNDNPQLTILSSAIVMRTPGYNSSDEEPDYYEQYGEAIYKSKYLFDKKERMGLSSNEEDQLVRLTDTIPREVVADYENRRAYNLKTTLAILKLAKDSVINNVVVPQDDSAEYGYTAIDQKKVMTVINENGLGRSVLVYPGSDEVGATLLARFINDTNQYQPKVYALFSSTLGPSLIPNYEDRPFFETLKKHVQAINGKLVESMSEADIVLGYNTPGKIMQESWEQETNIDQTYYSFRDLNTFIDALKEAISAGKKVIVADSAFSNGGDRELINALVRENVFLGLYSYKGWNTNANTLGTTLAQGCIADSLSRETIKTNIYHLLDDFIYQAMIRMNLTKSVLKQEDLNYFDLKDKAEKINTLISQAILDYYNNHLTTLANEVAVKSLITRSPWNRMFETELEFDIHIREGERVEE